MQLSTNKPCHPIPRIFMSATMVFYNKYLLSYFGFRFPIAVRTLEPSSPLSSFADLPPSCQIRHSLKPQSIPLPRRSSLCGT